MLTDCTIIMGGSGGLGSAVARHFADAENWSFDTRVDLTNPHSINTAVKGLRDAQLEVRRIVNCAGHNFIVPFDDLAFTAASALFRLNALALPAVVQSLRVQKLLPAGAIICNVISNAAKVPMTHSLAYNASKAAQEMVTRQMARELREYSIFGVSPNKLAGTPMSRQIEGRVRELRGWTVEEAAKYQLAALPAGVETPVSAVAQFISDMMAPIHHPFITGCIFPYGGPIQ